jgi:DNA-binding response OmpR family regulator
VATILIVEDDVEIRQRVSKLLRDESHQVEEAEDASSMEVIMERVRPDLVVLDLMLPGEDGLSICRRLRSRDRLLILMLSAKSEEIDRVIGLEVGADDYLVKPFGSREFLARIRALLRRGSQEPSAAPCRRFAFDRFIIDLDARHLSDDKGMDLFLTSAEFDLLACFVQRPRRVLTRDQILDLTRGRASGPLDRTVDMLVSRVRKKLENAKTNSALITTIRNGGYLFTAKVTSAP